jgi:hypothetical protein
MKEILINEGILTLYYPIYFNKTTRKQIKQMQNQDVTIGRFCFEDDISYELKENCIYETEDILIKQAGEIICRYEGAQKLYGVQLNEYILTFMLQPFKGQFKNGEDVHMTISMEYGITGMSFLCVNIPLKNISGTVKKSAVSKRTNLLSGQ